MNNEKLLKFSILNYFRYYDTRGLKQTVNFVSNGYGFGVEPMIDISHGNVVDGTEPVIKAIAAEQPKENVVPPAKFVAKHWFDNDRFTRYDLSTSSKKQAVDPAKSIVAEPVKPIIAEPVKPIVAEPDNPAIIDLTKLLPVTEPIQKEGFAETVQPGAQSFDDFSYYYFPSYYNPPYSYFVQFRYTSSF